MLKPNEIEVSDGSFGHDIIEVFSRYLPSIGGSSLKHLLQFAGIHSFSKLFGNSSNIIEADVPSTIIIEKIKDSVNTGLNQIIVTLVSLSPNLAVMASKNS